MKDIRIIFWSVLTGLLLSISTTAMAQPKTELKPEAIEAFDNFIKEMDEQYQLILNGKKPFLWVSQQDPDVQERVRGGEIVIVKERENIDVPNGIIHIWGVSTFMPDASAEDVVKLLQDYDRHKDVYPSVVDSKLLESNGNTVKGFLRFMYKKVITAVLNTEHESTHTKVGENKYSLRVRSTRIAEVENPGEASEKELPPGKDSGFMWRLNTYWVIAEAEGGVFVECGSVTLTRNIPFGLGWLIKPFITSIPRDSLEELVQATRVAVHK